MIKNAWDLILHVNQTINMVNIMHYSLHHFGLVLNDGTVNTRHYDGFRRFASLESNINCTL